MRVTVDGLVFTDVHQLGVELEKSRYCLGRYHFYDGPTSTSRLMNRIIVSDASKGAFCYRLKELEDIESNLVEFYCFLVRHELLLQRREALYNKSPYTRSFGENDRARRYILKSTIWDLEEILWG